jgi:hypothetical protein
MAGRQEVACRATFVSKASFMVLALMADEDSFRFFSREQVDKILYEGAKRGPAGSHAAIERILKFESMERAALWRRIRRLKHQLSQIAPGRAAWNSEDDRLLRSGYERGWSGRREAVRELLRRHPDWRPHLIWRRAATLGLVQKTRRRGQERSQRPWSEEDDRILLNLSGYKDVRVIGKKLLRSANAVRSRLSVLGKSSRVHKEGYAQRTLSEELHLGCRTIRHLIVEGLLEVRDPRITRESLKSLSKMGIVPITAGQCAQEAAVLAEKLGSGHHNVDRPGISLPNIPDVAPLSKKCSRATRVWMEVAKAQSTSLQTVEGYIVQGVLKLYDPRITERSLQSFCQRNGSLVNYDFLKRETRSWLESSMDFVRSGGEALTRRLEASRKHARAVRKCGCGREVRGNAFFRHIKSCRQAKPRADGMANG